MTPERVEEIWKSLPYIDLIPLGPTEYKAALRFRFAQAMLAAQATEDGVPAPAVEEGQRARDLEFVMLQEDRDGAFARLAALQAEVTALIKVAVYADSVCPILRKAGYTGKAQALERRIKEAYDLSTDKRVYGKEEEQFKILGEIAKSLGTKTEIGHKENPNE
jgi:hypothetical protein